MSDKHQPPRIEPIILARKPLSEKTVATNVLKWGTGSMNVDACRIGTQGGTRRKSDDGPRRNSPQGTFGIGRGPEPTGEGRFPANVTLDSEAARLLDQQAPASRFFHVAEDDFPCCSPDSTEHHPHPPREENPALTTKVIHGDCLHVLRGMEDNSVDAIVTDPPYGLSNTSPDKVTETIIRWAQGDREYVPQGKGFMGAAWDGFVPPPAVWDECYRVLKPGGHMAVFAGTRTMDLMTLGIRLAGLEIRDSLCWVYGSGFPKSQDVGKAIDKARTEDLEPAAEVARFLVAEMEARGITRSQVNVHFGHSTAGSGAAQQWTTTRTDKAIKPRVPKWEQWQELRSWLNLPATMDAEVWRLNGNKGKPGENWQNAEVIGTRKGSIGRGNWRTMEGRTDETPEEFQEKAPATDAAKQWSGWGTALKPAFEPIILARKPIRGTVASNVLEWGTGAINVDATRIKAGSDYHDLSVPMPDGVGGVYDPSDAGRSGTTFQPAQGRFPANVVLDTVTAGLLDQQSGIQRDGVAVNRNKDPEALKPNDVYGKYRNGERPDQTYGSGGGASRFFHVAENLDRLDTPFKYCAKAPKKERPTYEDEDGNIVQHSTVKPRSLMQWICRLIVPPGGTVLDPFAGSGTTVEAAILEGFNPIGIEAHGPYIRLIQQRVTRATDNTTQDPQPDLFEGAA